MKTLIGIGMAAKLLDTTAWMLRRNAELFGLNVEKTPGGHLRFDLSEVRSSAEKLRQQKLVELDRLNAI